VITVGMNLVFLVPGETGGMEIYARELITRLAERPGLELVAFVSQEGADAAGAPWTDGVRAKTVRVHSRRRAEWVLGEQVHVPAMAAAERCAVIHSLASTAPLWGRGRRVTTIHDLNYKLMPEAHFGLRAVGMRALVPAAARRSDRIITGAQAVKDDLVTHLGTSADLIDVVPHGVSADPAVAATPEAELRARLDLGRRPVLLSVSAKRPHKNLARLLDAIAAIPAGQRPALVLPGYPTAHETELRQRAAALGLSRDVVFLPWVATEALEGLYRLAAGFVFPSLHEGFGLPVLEAMARGVPVACSASGAVGEVAGRAALTFDPNDTREIRDAIERLLGDEREADRLREAGRARARTFTWERTAELTHASYRRALTGA
jgi:glycosyltransferase involved in cell wall biosynthesis